MSIAEDLIAEERAGWDALVAGRGGEHYREHLASHAVMAFGFGTLDRDAAIRAMEQARAWETYEISDEHVLALGRDAGVLVYRVAARRPGQPAYSAVVSSTFVREDGVWRLAFHQQSPAP